MKAEKKVTVLEETNKEINIEENNKTFSEQQNTDKEELEKPNQTFSSSNFSNLTAVVDDDDPFAEPDENIDDIQDFGEEVQDISEQLEDTNAQDEETPNNINNFDSKVLSAEEYHVLWLKMVMKFTETEPILASCCNDAEDFIVNDGKLEVYFKYGATMNILNGEKNKKIILDGLFEGRKAVPTNFIMKDKEVDEVQEKIKKLKGLFDSRILKITKK